MKLPVYLDYAATTPVDVQVAEKMMQHLTLDGIFGNPGSRSHRYGWEAEEAVDVARNHIADLVGADSREIIFTSGSTESNNLAIKGATRTVVAKGSHIITSVTEHKSVLDTCIQLEKEGFSVTRLVPSKNGIIAPQQLSDALRENTILVSLMHVNNETGIIQDIASFGKLCRGHKVLFHIDATQSIGKIPININDISVDLMSFSGHKVYGPKGIGALFVRHAPWVQVAAQIHGGGHERGMRSGTLAVHQIVGMGEAYNIALKLRASEMSRLRILRDYLWQGLQCIEGVVLNSILNQSVPTILNVSFRGVNGSALIMAIKDLAVSTGSACISSALEPSYVLLAMGLDKKLAHSSIRFSLGRFTTFEEIEYAISQMRTVIARLSEFS